MPFPFLRLSGSPSTTVGLRCFRQNLLRKFRPSSLLLARAAAPFRAARLTQSSGRTPWGSARSLLPSCVGRLSTSGSLCVRHPVHLLVVHPVHRLFSSPPSMCYPRHVLAPPASRPSLSTDEAPAMIGNARSFPCPAPSTSSLYRLLPRPSSEASPMRPLPPRQQETHNQLPKLQ